MTIRRQLVVALALLCVGCTATVGAPPGPVVAGASRDPVTVAEGQSSPPSGTVRVAYPDPVDRWWQAEVEDLAAGDLAALWSLPLYRTDPLGRPVPALATEARVVDDPGGWSVEVDLAAGEWSDGTPVTSADVVATAEALAAARPDAWGAWRAAVVVDADTVLLRFDRPFAAWAALLSRAPGVLPAHVLADGGLTAFDDDLPVTGGWFRLAGRERGLRSTFTANTGSPLGPPGAEGVQVLVVPDHDVALGLLADDEVDVVLGHVALDPDARRALVPGAVGGAAFGGSRFELVWDPDARADADVRRAAAAGLDPGPFVDGLLRGAGRRPGGVLPALAPVRHGGAADGASGEVAVQLVRTVEGLGLLGRLLQAELDGAGVAMSLVRVDPPQHLERPVDVDGRLRLVRVPPQRSAAALLAAVGLDPSPGLQADADGTAHVDPVGPQVMPTAGHAEVAAMLAEDPRVVPVAEVAVAHAWIPERVDGVTPSGWPGLALWDVGSWTVPAALGP